MLILVRGPPSEYAHHDVAEDRRVVQTFFVPGEERTSNEIRRKLKNKKDSWRCCFIGN